MNTQTTTFEGRTYEVVTDEAKRNEMLVSYCQVYRLRKNGTRGRKIVTISLIHSLLKLSRGEA